MSRFLQTVPGDALEDFWMTTAFLGETNRHAFGGVEAEAGAFAPAFNRAETGLKLGLIVSIVLLAA